MNQNSPDTHWWLGLCRKTPVFRASETGGGYQPEPAHVGSPDGGAGGPETIRRGIGAALSGTKTLIHNPQLLWFSLLAGLVLVAHLIAQAVIHFLSEWLFFFDTNTLLPSLVLTFVAWVLAVFCLVFLLAGFVLSLSSKEGGTVSFFQGLKQAKKYLVPLTGGSVVAALAGILLFAQPFIAQGVLFVSNPQWLLFAGSSHAGIPSLLIQTFAIEFLTVFCLVILLAGLVLSLSSTEGGTVSFFQGLKQAKKYLMRLTAWSVVMSLAGTLIYIVGQYSYDLTWFQPFNIISALSTDLSMFLFYVHYTFPFNILLAPTLYLPSLPPEFGGDGWLITWALENTLILSAVTVFLFVLTLFVVPLLVLEKKSLKEAVFGLFTLMKKIWGEVASCVLGLGMVVLAAWIVFLLFRFSFVDLVSWVAGPMDVSFTHHSDAWIAAGLLYILALFSLVFVVATVGGIAALNLYTSAKIRADTRIR
ncbi:hypothetical protein [Methanoregula sp.]|uniref:hypothetical protein n=1 Tax=Methanoregula sp. TaxID=2052170 RepID=UPI002369AC59|nr:hypothetical protein [Methanoregula sp.]MDD1687542.1 hypothetical protein [Methanoregula sp.]